MFLDEVIAHQNSPSILFASFDDKTKQIVYQHPNAIEINEARKSSEMIQFSDPVETAHWDKDADLYGRSDADMQMMQLSDSLTERIRDLKFKDPGFDEATYLQGFVQKHWSIAWPEHLVDEQEARTDAHMIHPPHNSGMGSSNCRHIVRDRRSNHVSIVAIPEHEMYVQIGQIRFSDAKCGYQYHFMMNDAERQYEKVKAGNLTKRRLKSSNNDSCVLRMAASAQEGCFVDDKSSTAALIKATLKALGQSTPDQEEAFMELYGFWLGDGSLSYSSGKPRAVVFTQFKETDKAWLEERLHKCRLQAGDGYRHCVDQATPGYTKHKFEITDTSWKKFYFTEYDYNYEASDRSHLSQGAAVDLDMQFSDAVGISIDDDAELQQRVHRSLETYGGITRSLAYDDDDRGTCSSIGGDLFSSRDSNVDGNALFLDENTSADGETLHSERCWDCEDQLVEKVALEREIRFGSGQGKMHFLAAACLRPEGQHEPSLPFQSIYIGRSNNDDPNTSAECEPTHAKANMVRAAKTRVVSMAPTESERSNISMTKRGNFEGPGGGSASVMSNRCNLPQFQFAFCTLRSNAEQRTLNAAACWKEETIIKTETDAESFLHEFLGSENFRELYALLSVELVEDINWLKVKQIIKKQLLVNGAKMPYDSQIAYALAAMHQQLDMQLRPDRKLARKLPARLSEMKKVLTAGGDFEWNYKKRIFFDEAEARVPGKFLPVLPQAALLPGQLARSDDMTIKQEKMFDKQDLPSVKRLVWWYVRLHRNLAASILRGYREADGSTKGDVHVLFAPSVCFRDQLICLCLHAGYSARFKLVGLPGSTNPYTIKKSYCRGSKSIELTEALWAVFYSQHNEEAPPDMAASATTPVIKVNEGHVQKVSGYSGRTWCATMPSGYVIVRRARKHNGDVVCASVPTIQGNCFDGKFYPSAPNSLLPSVSPSNQPSPPPLLFTKLCQE